MNDGLQKIFIWLFVLMVGVMFYFALQPEELNLPEGFVVVDFWHSMGGPLGNLLNSMIDEFNSTVGLEKKIFVRSMYMGSYEVLKQKIVAAIAAHKPPDIAQVYEAWTMNLIDADAILSIEHFAADDPEFNIDDFIPKLRENVTVDDVMWAIPFNKSIPVMYWNKTHFEQAGLDPDTPPATWYDLLEYSRLLTVDNDGDGRIDRYGYTLSANSWYVNCMIFQNDGRVLSDDNREIMINSPEAVEVFEIMRRFLKEDVGYISRGYDFQNDFINSRVSIILASSVSRTFMNRDITFPFGISNLPALVREASVLSGTNVVIFKKRSDPDYKVAQASYEFLKWFTASRQTAHWAINSGYMPVRKSALVLPEIIEAKRLDPSLNPILTEVDNLEFEPSITAWIDLRVELGQLAEEILDPSGFGTSVRDILDYRTERMQEILRSEY